MSVDPVEQETLTDYLTLWHPVADEEMDEYYLNWGPAAPGSSADVPVRVKNMSEVYFANDIVLSVYDTGDVATPSVAAQHLVSVDGATFAATVNMGDLAPQAISGPVTLRRVTDPAAQLDEFDFLLHADPTSWS